MHQLSVFIIAPPSPLISLSMDGSISWPLMVSQQEFRSELPIPIQGRAIDALRGVQENFSVASGVCTATVYD